MSRVVNLEDTKKFGYTLVDDILNREASLVVINKRNTHKYVVMINEKNLSWVIFDGSSTCIMNKLEELLNVKYDEFRGLIINVTI